MCVQLQYSCLTHSKYILYSDEFIVQDVVTMIQLYTVCYCVLSLIHSCYECTSIGKLHLLVNACILVDTHAHIQMSRASWPDEYIVGECNDHVIVHQVIEHRFQQFESRHFHSHYSYLY